MSLTSSLQAWLWTAGRFEPCQGLPVEDRGFRYGMALFESLRVWRGAPLFLPEHLDRLRTAARARQFPVEDEALRALGPLLLGMPDGFVRLYLTGGDGSSAAPVLAARLVAMWEERTPQDEAEYRLALSPDVYRPLFGGLKTANYWANLDALQQAHRRGFQEALLFNEHAELVSATMGNVFLVTGSQVRTPALACGARDGVVRAWVMERQAVREGSLFLHDVEAADEIFLTNSWRGLTPVSDLEDRGPRRASELSQALRRRYHQEVLGLPG